MKRLLPLLLLAVAACKGTEPPVLVSLEGKVVKKGQPLAFVMVSLHPLDVGEGRTYEGAADKDGAFKLEAPRGKYKVTLLPLAVGSGNTTDPGGGGLTSPDVKAGGVPAAYRAVTSTPLPVLDLSAGPRRDVVLEVQ